MKKFIYIITALFASSLFAKNALSTGITGGYDSNIILKNFKQQGGSKVEKGGSHYNIDLSYQYNSEAYDLELSNIVEWIPEFNEYSKIEQTGQVSTYNEWENSSLTSGVALTYSSTDFDNLIPYSSNINLFSEFFYDHTLSHSSLISFHIDYQHPFADIINYLTGFSLGFEVGHYYYINEGKNYIMLSWKGSGYFYDPVNFKIETDLQSIDVVSKNRYLQNSLILKTKFYINIFELSLAAKWHYLIWLDTETWADFEKDVEKRRADHLFDLTLSTTMKLYKALSLQFNCGYQYNISSLGAESVDYIDWSYDRYFISLGITLDL